MATGNEKMIEINRDLLRFAKFNIDEPMIVKYKGKKLVSEICRLCGQWTEDQARDKSYTILYGNWIENPPSGDWSIAAKVRYGLDEEFLSKVPICAKCTHVAEPITKVMILGKMFDIIYVETGINK